MDMDTDMEVGREIEMNMNYPTTRDQSTASAGGTSRKRMSQEVIGNEPLSEQVNQKKRRLTNGKTPKGSKSSVFRLLDLPLDLVYEIFGHLDEYESLMLGLAQSDLYKIHWAIHGPMEQLLFDPESYRRWRSWETSVIIPRSQLSRLAECPSPLLPVFRESSGCLVGNPNMLFLTAERLLYLRGCDTQYLYYRVVQFEGMILN
ncbi:hypothetical protein HYFRA_00011360 [Hymenoscyphus fraxineus]|uniref:F-box domain-containing protein n=1 Tax=Hymenoscyphus fraxineus TaxID=746836 RepID=A0A9N9KWV9_9HELO|nr:hypothetical protein HYFRA_00011360 [Hymenoscyphus fraxineus]